MTHVMTVKRLIYQNWLGLCRLWWNICGGRRVRAFGQSLRLVPSTSWLDHRKLRYPKRPFPCGIVRYVDFVQMNAICRLALELDESPTIVDVGAFHGEYAVLLGKMVQSKRGKLIAIEPNPESFRILERNVRLNNLERTVFCESVAVSDTSGKQVLSLDGSQSQVGSSAGVAVRTATLDELLAKHGIARVDLMIIDVEGAELSVLRSFPWTTTSVGTIFCELHPNDWHVFGCTGDRFWEFLETHHFRCIDMYLTEHKRIEGTSYIGPTMLIPASASDGTMSH